MNTNNPTLTLNAKQLGRKQTLRTDTPISYPAALHNQAGDLPLRDLIAHIVTTEIESFHTRQEQRRFLPVMTADQIETAAQTGKIQADYGRPSQTADLTQAIRNAHQSFVDGLYFVFVDDTQYEELDQQIPLQPNSTISFIRLVALAGG